MSYVMRNFRLNCINSIKELLKRKKEIPLDELKIEIMKRFTVSEYTAKKYINEIVMMGIAKINDNHVIYIFDQPKRKRQKEEMEHE
jgi:predicted DNA-binding transcriptional regulator YafY